MINLHTEKGILSRVNGSARLFWLLESGEILDFGIVRVIYHTIPKSGRSHKGSIKLLYNLETIEGVTIITPRLISHLNSGGSLEKYSEMLGMQPDILTSFFLEWEITVTFFNPGIREVDRHTVKPGAILVTKTSRIEKLFNTTVIRKVLNANK